MAKEMNFEVLNANIRMVNKRSEMLFEQARINGELTPEAAKLNELASDEVFCGKLLMAENAEEAQRIFSENGLELTAEEVNMFGEHIVNVSRTLSECEEELSEEELEQIAGGAGTASQSFGAVADTIGSTADIAGQIFEQSGAKSAFEGLGTMIKSAATHAVQHVFKPIIIAKRIGGWIKSWF